MANIEIAMSLVVVVHHSTTTKLLVNSPLHTTASWKGQITDAKFYLCVTRSIYRDIMLNPIEKFKVAKNVTPENNGKETGITELAQELKICFCSTWTNMHDLIFQR